MNRLIQSCIRYRKKCGWFKFINRKYFYLTLLALLSSLNLFCQEMPELPLDSISHKIAYTEVVHSDGLINKDELYSRAKKWIAYKFSSNKTSSVQLDDEVNNTIICKSSMNVFGRALGMNTYVGDIEYSIAIYIKDSKYKYIITEFEHIGYKSDNSDMLRTALGPCEKMLSGKQHQRFYGQILSQLDANIKKTIDDLKSAMKGVTYNLKKEDW